METIWTWIPQRYRLYEPMLIFNSEEDGFNLRTLVAQCSDYVPTLVFIKTKEKQTFGVFCDQVWEPQDHYYGSGETFLFSLEPVEKVYPWWSEGNQCYMRLTPTEVTWGGGNEYVANVLFVFIDFLTIL